MSCLVLCHFMYRVVDSVQTVLLCQLCQLKLSCAGAVFSCHSYRKVFLGGVGNALAQKLRKLGSVLCLLVCRLFPVQTDFRIALTEGYSCHCQVHSDLSAFAVEVGTQSLNDFGRNLTLFAVAHNVLGCPGGVVLHHFLKFFCGRLAQRTSFRRELGLYNFSANFTSPLFHDLYSFFSFILFSGTFPDDRHFSQIPTNSSRQSSTRKPSHPTVSRTSSSLCALVTTSATAPQLRHTMW